MGCEWRDEIKRLNLISCFSEANSKNAAVCENAYMDVILFKSADEMYMPSQYSTAAYFPSHRQQDPAADPAAVSQRIALPPQVPNPPSSSSSQLEYPSFRVDHPSFPVFRVELRGDRSAVIHPENGQGPDSIVKVLV